MFRSFLAISFALSAAWLARPAQAADLGAFSGHGSIAVTTEVSGASISLGGDIGFFRSGPLVRIDILRLGLPGVDPAIAALAGQMLGGNTVSAVYDARSGTMRAWSNANRTYFQSTRGGSTPPPVPATAAGGSLDPLGALLRFLAPVTGLQTFDASLHLTGPGRVGNYATTGVDLVYRKQPIGGALEAYTAHLELANDLSGFPVRTHIEARGNRSGLNGTMQLDLTQIDPGAQAPDRFAVPSGYVRVASIGEIFKPR